ncbi:glutaminase A [Microbacterium sp. No. 7]|uniref:glutaminase A n=1 Tax=Microbacterium sp. No. 7 TaxID=1714373 RepID=UPI0006CFE4E3|nr:glutaminase A [Microbacterium sp. No. 7]ALJ21216.1 glutaminase [Microbacterium sp. No. 7]
MAALGNPVSRAFARVLADVRAGDHPGRLADYIPELAKADPDAFALSAASVSGHTYAAGDSTVPFTIQSISKAFVYALALAEHGVAAVTARVGVEPSGEAFNAISFDAQGRPANPMINAGAIVTTSLIAGATADERFERIRRGLSAFAGRELRCDEAVAASESATGDRNRALAMLARSSGALDGTVDDAVEAYFRQCALLVDTTDLAVMGATLANDGVNPVTDRRIVPSIVARDTLSLMSSCGMYDRSGQWLFDVGLPAKSGVGGGIVAVAPGEYGIGVFSAPLDAVGNSARGVAALRMLSEGFGLHLFRHPDRPVSPVQAVEIDARTETVTMRLRGVVDFVAAEQIAYQAAETMDATGSRTLVLDAADVAASTRVAALLLGDLFAHVREAGADIVVVDPEGTLDPS